MYTKVKYFGSKSNVAH